MICKHCGQPNEGDSTYCDSCGGALQGPALESGESYDDWGATPVSSFLGVLDPGSTVAGYQIIGELGEGGMGTVYHARHINDFSEVALKVLAPHLVRKPAILARFKQEAGLQMALQHTHVVRVYELVEEDPIHAIVMEYVDGVTLEQMIHEHTGPMVPSRIKAVMLPVLAAVGYAHSKGVVHRDLKPSNIMLTTVDGRDTAKVTDFGIAKALSDGGVETATASKLGTVWYMAPEQCKSSKEVDARSDVYSLGVTLYEMATGKVPFTGESEFEVMLAHIETPPQPPHSHYPGVSPELEQIILTAMEKAPDRRFDRAPDFADQLRNVPDEPGSWVDITGPQRPLDESGEHGSNDSWPGEDVPEISSGSFSESSGSIPAIPEPPCPRPEEGGPPPPVPVPHNVKTPSVPVDPVTGEPARPLVLPRRLILMAAGGAALVTFVAFVSVWLKSC